VFCHPDGRPHTRDDLNWRFGKMTRRAGIGRWHAHEARHTAVSIMSHNGVLIQDISDTMGHKSTRHRDRLPARHRPHHPGRCERHGRRVRRLPNRRRLADKVANELVMLIELHSKSTFRGPGLLPCHA
jgi:integrase